MGNGRELHREHIVKAVTILRVEGRAVGGVDAAFLPADCLLAAISFGDLREVVHEQEQVAPFLKQRSTLLRELQFVAVVGPGGVGLLKLANGWNAPP